MVQKYCPTCGLPMVSDAALTLLRGARQRALFHMIRQAGAPGISVAACMDRLYGNDPLGGPDDVIISVMAGAINRKIKAVGLQLVCGRGAGATYRVVAA
jgi:hypothetical protein